VQLKYNENIIIVSCCLLINLTFVYETGCNQYFPYFVAFCRQTVAQMTLITISRENVSLETVLNEIEQKSSYYFLYNQKLIDTENRVSVNLKNATVEQILDSILPGIGISYIIYGRQIILLPPDEADSMRMVQQTIEERFPMPSQVILFQEST